MRQNRWLYFLAFAAAWLALRVFWIGCDSGLPSIWEYGYNVTDEGYYMGAAKDKFLWGAFCDFARGESFTFGYSPLTHGLAWLGYAVFGLTDWGLRVPYIVLYFLAWASAFFYVSRRHSPGMAFAMCLAFSSMPVVVAYERTACNDLAIGAIGVLAFCLAAGKGVWRVFASAAVLGAAAVIKPSVWVVLPIVAASVLSARKTRSAWLDLALFLVASFVSVWGWKSLALLSLLPETAIHGMSASEIIRRTTTHNPLPSLTDVDVFLRGFSSFPREVCFKAFGTVACLVSLVPLTMAVRQVMARQWNFRLLLFLAVPAYAAAVSVNNSICLHYYHPVLMMLPILCVEVVAEFKTFADDVSQGWKPLAWSIILLLALVALGMLFVLSADGNPRVAIEYYSTISNLPRKTVWGYNGAAVLVAALPVAVILAYRRGLAALGREGWAWLLLGAIGASVAFSGLPAVRVASYVRQNGWDYFWTAAVALAFSGMFLLLVFGNFRCRHANALRMWFAPAIVALSFLLSPVWRASVVEMLKPGTHVHRSVADEVAKLVSPDAVVIGERSRQVLMSKPIKTATTMPGCDPIPIVKKLHEKNPSTPLYALADSQNAYNLQHFQKHAKEYRLDLVKTFKMPSFGTGQPADVYLCKVIPLRTSDSAPASK